MKFDPSGVINQYEAKNKTRLSLLPPPSAALLEPQLKLKIALRKKKIEFRNIEVYLKSHNKRYIRQKLKRNNLEQNSDD